MKLFALHIADILHISNHFSCYKILLHDLTFCRSSSCSTHACWETWCDFSRTSPLSFHQLANSCRIAARFECRKRSHQRGSLFHPALYGNKPQSALLLKKTLSPPSFTVSPRSEDHWVRAGPGRSWLYRSRSLVRRPPSKVTRSRLAPSEECSRARAVRMLLLCGTWSLL